MANFDTSNLIIINWWRLWNNYLKVIQIVVVISSNKSQCLLYIKINKYKEGYAYIITVNKIK